MWEHPKRTHSHTAFEVVKTLCHSISEHPCLPHFFRSFVIIGNIIQSAVLWNVCVRIGMYFTRTEVQIWWNQIFECVVLGPTTWETTYYFCFCFWQIVLSQVLCCVSWLHWIYFTSIEVRTEYIKHMHVGYRQLLTFVELGRDAHVVWVCKNIVIFIHHPSCYSLYIWEK